MTGLAWDREKIVVASISEVMPHPNADRLTLCKLFDGEREHIVLTGAPNLFEYKGKGPLPKPLMVAYAKEGAQIYDGHAEGLVLTTLKPAKIRGIDSLLDGVLREGTGHFRRARGHHAARAGLKPGTPLVDVLGDAVLEVNLLPSFARCASMAGLAREIAAITGKPFTHCPNCSHLTVKPATDYVEWKSQNRTLNPRFMVGLIGM